MRSDSEQYEGPSATITIEMPKAPPRLPFPTWLHLLHKCVNLAVATCIYISCWKLMNAYFPHYNAGSPVLRVEIEGPSTITLTSRFETTAKIIYLADPLGQSLSNYIS